MLLTFACPINMETRISIPRKGLFTKTVYKNREGEDYDLASKF